MTLAIPRTIETMASAVPAYQLEMKEAAIGSAGVEDFLWPVPVAAHKPMRDAAARTLMGGLRVLSTRDALARDAFFLLAHHVIVDYLAIFHSLLVARAFRAAGREPMPPVRGRMLVHLLAGRAPSAPLIVGHLRRGPGMPKALRAPLRFLRDLTIRDGLVRRPLRRPDYDKDIIAIVVDELLAAHARSIDEPVIFRRPHLWFDPRTVEEGGLAADDLARCIDLALKSFEAGLDAAGIPAPDYLSAYIRGWLGDAIQLTAAHLRALPRCGTPVPKRLWTGSGGNIWSRLLRFATRRQGGAVWAHDHGAGAGQFLDEWFKNPIEFDTCDTFVTFTPAQAAGLVDHIAPDFKVRLDAPVLKGLPQPGVEAAPIRMKASGANPKPTVMVLSSFYFGDLATHQAFMPDVPFLDWEARLLAKLREWGFPAIYKPHPLIVTRPPLDIAARFGATEIDLPSEKVLHLADVLVLPDPSSTAFATGLTSDRPAVFIDFGLFRFRPEARELLDKRCASVNVPLDATNRPDPDWEAVRTAILAASERSDYAYVDRYYGSVYRH